ncbi:MAG: amidohydrolase family protein [Christensenellales bacterium]
MDKIIDIHAHIYPEKIAKKAVESIGSFYGISMVGGNGTSENLIASGGKIGVEKYVVHSTATKPEQVESINNFICGECKLHAEFIGFATLHPDMTEEEIAKEVERVKEMGLHGIKLHPDFQRFFIDEDRAEKIYRQVEGKLPILFHTGDPRYDFSSPLRMSRVAKRHPNLISIGAHFGGYGRWDEVEVYKGLDNMFFDTSSTLFKLPVEQARKIIKMLGIEKFMFGVDFPMWEHDKELERFYGLRLSDSDNEKILYQNALRFLSLTGGNV